MALVSMDRSVLPKPLDFLGWGNTQIKESGARYSDVCL